MDAPTRTVAVPEWGARPARYARVDAFLLCATGLACLLGVGAGAALGSLWAGIVVAGVIAAGAAARYLMIDLRVRRGVGARPLREDAPRLANLVDGLAGDLDMLAPDRYVIAADEPNALVWGVRRPALAVTTGLLQSFTRTETEAVVAHCLVRIRDGSARVATTSLLAGRAGSRFVPQVGYEDDARACAVTRYPPALLSALVKAAPAGRRFAPLWFVAEARSHRPTDERVTALAEL